LNDHVTKLTATIVCAHVHSTMQDYGSSNPCTKRQEQEIFAAPSSSQQLLGNTCRPHIVANDCWDAKVFLQ
jgi:hypothetical protein